MSRHEFTPLVLATLVATAVAGVVGGYFIGLRANPRIESLRTTLAIDAATDPDAEVEEVSGDESSDDEDHPSDSDFKTFSDVDGECKLVLLVRSDLGMTKGKIAAQCGHATLYCYKTIVSRPFLRPLLNRWESGGQAKIALRIDSEDAMSEAMAMALSLGIIARVVRDAGRTQIAPNSATVLGIGPAPKKVIDQITGSLKLL